MDNLENILTCKADIHKTVPFLTLLKTIDEILPVTVPVRNHSTFNVQYNKKKKKVDVTLKLNYYTGYIIKLNANFFDYNWIFKATLDDTSCTYCVNDIELKNLIPQSTLPFIIMSYFLKWFSDKTEYYKEEESRNKINTLFPKASYETKYLLNICLQKELMKN